MDVLVATHHAGTSAALAATAAGLRVEPGAEIPTPFATTSTRPGSPGRTGRWTASAVHGPSGFGAKDGRHRRQRPRLPPACTRRRVFLLVPEPHERDRLKHAGRRLEGQTVKVVGNGGGGATRGWNPATGKPRQWRRTSAEALFGCPLTTNPVVRKAPGGLARQVTTFDHRIGTVRDFTVRPGGSASAGGTIHGLFGGRGSRRSLTTNQREGTGKARRSFQCDVRGTPCPSGYREPQSSAPPVLVAIFGSWPVTGWVVRAGGSPSGEPRLDPACAGIGLRAGGGVRTNGRRTLSARTSTGWIQWKVRSNPLTCGTNRSEPGQAINSDRFVGCWAVVGHGEVREDPRVNNPFGGGSNATFPSRHVPYPRPGFPVPHSERSERWRGEQPQGRILDDKRSASIASRRDDDGTQVPEGE
jgi:hypothetical protein